MLTGVFVVAGLLLLVGAVAAYLTGKYNTLIRARQRCLEAWLALSGALVPPKGAGKQTAVSLAGGVDRTELHRAAASFGNPEGAETFSRALVAFPEPEVGVLVRAYNDAARFHNTIRLRSFYWVTSMLCGLKALPVLPSDSVS